jgi:DNA-binding NarL/FixJ family response regulator
MERLSIFLIDPNQLFREGLKLLLNDHDCDVAGEARSLYDLTPPLAPGRRIDVVLMGSACRAYAAEPALGAIRAHHPNVKTVILTDLGAEAAAGIALCPTDAQLGNDLSVATLVRAFGHVMAGERVGTATGEPSSTAAAEIPGTVSSWTRRILRRITAALSIGPLVANR